MSNLPTPLSGESKSNEVKPTGIINRYFAWLTAERCEQHQKGATAVLTAISSALSIAASDALVKVGLLVLTLVGQLFIIFRFEQRREELRKEEKYKNEKLTNDLDEKETLIKKREVYYLLPTVLDALYHAKDTGKPGEFYTTFCYTLLMAIASQDDVKQTHYAVYLYCYDPRTGMVGRVGGVSRIAELTTKELHKSPTTLKSVKEIRHYGKLFGSDRKKFFFKNNHEIRDEIDADEFGDGFLTIGEQYYARKFSEVRGLQFAVEIVSCKGESICQNADEFLNDILTPFSRCLKVLDID